MSDLPIARITLFSSGVGYFEHRGSVEGTAEINLPFSVDAVNDALKSLIINDPAGNPAVLYPSKKAKEHTSKDQSIKLKKSSLRKMLNGFKGAEIEIFIPDSIKGKIVFVERRREKVNFNNTWSDFLSLLTEQGIKTICIDEIRNFIFSDSKITSDLIRALDLAINSRDERIRNLTIRLTGESGRNVTLSYVIPAALWKVSYRLDLSRENPLLQGWAIVDNNSDMDWDNVELALVTGKPVSFIQDLYKVHNLFRPLIPLLTEGISEAKTYDSGSKIHQVREDISMGFATASSESEYLHSISDESSDDDDNDLDDEGSSNTISDRLAETSSARTAGDQFEFTIRKPVSLARRQSAMLPLIEGEIQAEKYLVFSRDGKNQNGIYNPAICAELTNNTGMKLPAGPITVYDSGTYAGDALVKFFPLDEKRLISYAEDLSVSCSFNVTASEKVSFVKIDQGFMTLSRKYIYETVYSFRNAGKEPKKIIIEHPTTNDAELITPIEYSEKTHNLYRFIETLPSTNDFSYFTVTEEKTECEESEIINFHYTTLAQFISGNDISDEPVQKALQTAFSLNEKIEKAETTIKNLREKQEALLKKQERTRKNLEAAGSQSAQGKDYLLRLTKEDDELDMLEEKINLTENAIDKAKEDYENYILELEIE